jgi:hypothetical protein
VQKDYNVKSPTNPLFKVEVKKNYFFIKELKKSTPFIFGRATRISRTVDREEEGERKKQKRVATYHLIKKLSPTNPMPQWTSIFGDCKQPHVLEKAGACSANINQVNLLVYVSILYLFQF